MPKQWYTIQNKHNSAEILIYDVIGQNFFGEGVSAKELAEDISKLDVENIHVRINSPGGAVFEGTAIYNSLVNHKAKITVAVDGLAASIASVIAMAGETITMAENALMMIHDPMGMAMGTAEDLRRQADYQDKAKETIIRTYQSHVDKDTDELSDLMSAETWMNAEEAKEAGFVHEITAGIKMAASYDKSIFSEYKHVPENLANAVTDPEEKGDHILTLHIDTTEAEDSLKKIADSVKNLQTAADNIGSNQTEPENKGRSVGHLSKELDILQID